MYLQSERVSENVAVVVGLGLIGGSIALRLLARGWSVFGLDPDKLTQSAAAESGIKLLDSLDDIQAVSPNVVVVAGPLRTIPESLNSIAALTGTTCTVIDVGSVKGPIVASLSNLDIDFIRRFVPVHPMAGKESSGFENASESLLVNAPWALILDSGSSIDHALYALNLLTNEFNARVHPLGALGHDESVALISQLPHLMANALLVAVGQSQRSRSAFALAAGSFRDGTRVAGAAPDRTTAMVFDNREALVSYSTLLACELIASGMEFRGNRNIDMFARAAKVREELEEFKLVHERKSHLVLHRDSLFDDLISLGENGSSIALVSTDGDTFEFLVSGDPNSSTGARP